MGFKDLFKKKEPTKEMPVVQETDSNLKYRDIPIIITFNPEQSKAHIEEDYAVLNKEGIRSSSVSYSASSSGFPSKKNSSSIVMVLRSLSVSPAAR